jgi:universal stress protein A
MKMSDLIVCGTDFSADASSALAWAAAIAHRDGGRIELVHVEPRYTQNIQLLAVDTGQFEAAKTRTAIDHLREASERVAHEHGISVRPVLLRGEPHEEIVKHAQDTEARMIIVGGGGRTAVQRLTFGSVAERTARLAKCPVVVVPRAPGGQPWLAGQRATPARNPRVVVGVGAGDDRAILRFVGDLRRRAPYDVTFLQLYWPLEEYARLGLQGQRDLLALDPDVAKDLEPALRSKIAALPGQGRIDVDIRPAWGDPASNLLVAVEEHDAELVVVGHRDRHGLLRFFTGSIAERLARQSRYVAVACVPSDGAAADGNADIPVVRTVLAVTDLSDIGNAAIPYAYSLLHGGGSVVELCYVHEHVLPNPPYAYDLPNVQLTAPERDRLTKDLRALVPAAASFQGISTRISIVDGGKAAEAIVQAAERLKADLIVMASHGRGGVARTILGSVTQDVVHRSRRPVLIVRDR